MYSSLLKRNIMALFITQNVFYIWKEKKNNIYVLRITYARCWTKSIYWVPDWQNGSERLVDCFLQPRCSNVQQLKYFLKKKLIRRQSWENFYFKWICFSGIEYFVVKSRLCRQTNNAFIAKKMLNLWKYFRINCCVYNRMQLVL